MWTAISRTVLKLLFYIAVLLRQIGSSCCAVCPSFVGSIASAQTWWTNKTTRRTHTVQPAHGSPRNIFPQSTLYNTSVRHQRLLTNNKLCQHISLSQDAAQKRSNGTKLCHGGVHSDRHARTAYSLHDAFTFRTARTGPTNQRGVSSFRRNLRYCLPTWQRTAHPKLRRLNSRPF